MSINRKPKARVFRSHQWILPLKIDVVFDHHQPALSVIQIDAAGSVGQDRCAHSHAGENAHRKHHGLRRITFIQVHAPLHDHHWPLANVAQNQLACVPHGRGARKMWNLVVADANGIRHLVGKLAQP